MWLRVSGWPALRWATAPLLLLALTLNTILGPNAMSLSELGETCAQRPNLRLALFLLWSVAMAPAARAALYAPGLNYLRGLGMPRALGPGAMACLLLALHAPLTLLFLASGQPLAALLLSSAGLGVISLLLARPFAGWAQGIGLGLALASALAVFYGLTYLVAVVGIVLSAWRIPIAWRDAPARAQGRHRRAVVGGPWLAPASVMLLHLWRREFPLLLRCSFVLALGVAFLVQFAQANATIDLFVPLLIATTPFLAMVSMGIALGLSRAADGMRWMTVSMSVSVQRPVALSLVLVLLVSLSLALALTAPTMRWNLIGAALIHAIMWASLAWFLVRLDPAGSRVAMWFVLLAGIDMLAMAVLGPSTLIYELALALLCMARGASRQSTEPLHA